MENNNEHSDHMRHLRTLLKSAGYVSCRMSSDRRAMFFGGRTREWNIVARSNGDWFNLYTIVCTIPEEAGIRARLLEAAMRINQQMLVAKFVVGQTSLVLELDYRVEHLNVETLRGLVSLIYSNAEDHYAKLFRIVSGDDVLKALDDPALSLAS